MSIQINGRNLLREKDEMNKKITINSNFSNENEE